MKLSGSKGLSFVVAVWTAVAIACAMAVYAVFQYFTIPDVTVWELFVHHLWHVLVLGAVIHLFCWIAFHRMLVIPIQRIYLHLYAVGTGRLETLEIPTPIRELKTIVDGVNVMIRRMELGHDAQAVDRSQQSLATLRDLAKNLSPSESDTASNMLEEVAALESSLLSIIQTTPETQHASES